MPRSQMPYHSETTLADLIWPPRSLLSDAHVDCLGTLEADLWRALDVLYVPGCMCCEFPIAEATSPDILRPVCLAQLPLYNRARAALAYDDLSKPLVLNLKHGGRKDGCGHFPLGCWRLPHLWLKSIKSYQCLCIGRAGGSVAIIKLAGSCLSHEG